MSFDLNNKLSKYGLVININKYNSYCEIKHTTYICNSIDDCKNKLIDLLVLEFNNLHIDFPLDILDFEYIFLKQNYINTNVFNYMIFFDNEWIHPWEHQDIYTDVLDKLFENSIQDCQKENINNVPFNSDNEGSESE